MTFPEGFVFIQRTFPSANMVLVQGERPVLFDSGFGGDFDETRYLVGQAGIAPEDITLIVNSHYIPRYFFLRHATDAPSSRDGLSDFQVTSASGRKDPVESKRT